MSDRTKLLLLSIPLAVSVLSCLPAALACFGLQIFGTDLSVTVSKTSIKTGIGLLIAFVLLWTMYGIIARKL